MKTFIIVVETAFIAFMFGGSVGVALGEKKANRELEGASKEVTPA